MIKKFFKKTKKILTTPVNISANDVFMLSGMGCLFAGLYLSYGLGVALIVIGILLMIFGLVKGGG